MARRRIADSDDEEGDEQQQGSSRGRQAGSTGANGNGAMEVEGEDDHAQDEGDDQDDSEDQVVSGNAGSGRASKRRRNNGAGSATPRRNRSASDPETPNSAARRPKTYLGERDEAGYVPGSVVRIACENFLTYDSVTIRPGPRLNMIIGPNGTGKSSIVCAIALGLGFRPQVLGRASNISQFVKTGAEQGWIEVELKGRRGQPNPVIRRNINAVSDQSTYTLNEEKTTNAKVQDVVQSLNVQIDNLCSFLPQDKVKSFAAMGPIELLRETQRVGGHPKLSEWHEELIEVGRSKLTMDGKLAESEDQKKTLEGQLASMQRDVARFQERERIETQIKIFELTIPFVHYQDAKAKFEAARDAARAAKQRLDELEQANEPVRVQRDTFQHLLKALDTKRKDLGNYLAKAGNELDKKYAAADKASKASDDARENLENLKNDERARKKRIETLQSEIANMKRKAAKVVEEPNVEELKEEIGTIAGSIRQIKYKIETQQRDAKEVNADAAEVQLSRSKAEERLKGLHNASNRKEQALRQFDPVTYKALELLRRMKQAGRFNGEAYEPVRLCISASDPRFAAAIEGSLDRPTLMTFLFTEEADYQTFMNECDRAKLIVTAACLPRGTSMADFAPPLDAENLRGLGFDDYLINVVRGPEYVLTFLCQRARLHNVAFVGNPNANVNEAQLHSPNCPIKSYIVGNTRTNVTFSKYGNREVSLRTYTFRPARALADVGVDEEAVRNIKADLGGLTIALQELQGKLKEMQQQEQLWREEGAVLKEQKAALEQEKTNRVKAYTDYRKSVGIIASKEKELDKKLNEPSTDDRKQKLLRDLRKTCTSRLEALIVFKNGISKAGDVIDDTATVRLKQLQLNQDYQVYEAQSREQDAELEEAKLAFSEADEKKSLFKKEAVSTLEDATNRLHDASDDLRAGVDALKTSGKFPRLESLTEALDEQRQMLAMTHDVGRGIMNRYDACRNSLRECESTLAAHRRRLDGIEDDLNTTKNKWKPELDLLIEKIDEKFDASFKGMGCLGHVQLLEDADFAKWGIEIQVAFRDHEALAPLTAHRQSGGERSLSTIMFLMALTELAKAPFTLVDEINQGMDQRVERLVHDQLVAITCQEDSSQAFLLTPKLLPGLSYHPNLRVLTIYNGTWVPETFEPRAWLTKARVARKAE